MTTSDVRRRVVLSPDDVTPTLRLSPPVPQTRLRISGVDAEDVWTAGGSLLAAVSLTWVVYERLLALSGAFGFWVVAYVVFLAIYAAAAALQWSRQTVVDRLVAVALVTASVLVLVAVANQIVYTAYRGWPAIHHSNFWTSTMALTGPNSPITSGGMVHALVGSLEQLGLATALSVPLGVLAALFLVEIGGPLARPVRVIVEAMTALPEIIAGLFIYALFILTFGLQQSGFAASLALTVMMIPIVTRTSEVIIRLVPGPLREASYALGASQARTILNVVLPTARSGLSTAVVLAMARAVGETSPVLLTSGFSKFLSTNPFKGPQTSLPLYIYNYQKEAEPVFVQRAFGAAIALMLMVLVLFAVARFLGGKAPGEPTRRQRRRVVLPSAPIVLPAVGAPAPAPSESRPR